MFYYRKLTSKDKGTISQITNIHIKEINDITTLLGNEVINIFYELYLTKALIYGIFEEKSNLLIGFVGFEFNDSQIFSNLIKRKVFIFKLLRTLFSKDFFKLFEAIYLFIWMIKKNFYKKDKIQISYTVLRKNYQSKGIYGDLIFKILNDVYDEYKKDYFIKTYSNEKITNYYLSKG